MLAIGWHKLVAFFSLNMNSFRLSAAKSFRQEVCIFWYWSHIEVKQCFFTSNSRFCKIADLAFMLFLIFCDLLRKYCLIQDCQRFFFFLLLLKVYFKQPRLVSKKKKLIKKCIIIIIMSCNDSFIFFFKRTHNYFDYS